MPWHGPEPPSVRASLDRALKSSIVSVYRLNGHAYHGGSWGVSTPSH